MKQLLSLLTAVTLVGSSTIAGVSYASTNHHLQSPTSANPNISNAVFNDSILTDGEVTSWDQLITILITKLQQATDQKGDDFSKVDHSFVDVQIEDTNQQFYYYSSQLQDLKTAGKFIAVYTILDNQSSTHYTGVASHEFSLSSLADLAQIQFKGDNFYKKFELADGDNLTNMKHAMLKKYAQQIISFEHWSDPNDVIKNAIISDIQVVYQTTSGKTIANGKDLKQVNQFVTQFTALGKSQYLLANSVQTTSTLQLTVMDLTLISQQLQSATSLMNILDLGRTIEDHTLLVQDIFKYLSTALPYSVTDLQNYITVNTDDIQTSGSTLQHVHITPKTADAPIENTDGITDFSFKTCRMLHYNFTNHSASDFAYDDFIVSDGNSYYISPNEYDDLYKTSDEHDTLIISSAQDSQLQTMASYARLMNGNGQTYVDTNQVNVMAGGAIMNGDHSPQTGYEYIQQLDPVNAIIKHIETMHASQIKKASDGTYKALVASGLASGLTSVAIQDASQMQWTYQEYTFSFTTHGDEVQSVTVDSAHMQSYVVDNQAFNITNEFQATK